MSNPFNVTFGELPSSLIERKEEEQLVLRTFRDETPESKVYIITGPRGSGKTVLLAKLKKDFKEQGYLTVDLNSYGNMEEQFASKLYEEGKLWKLFLKPEFSFSFHGLTFSINGTNEISNVTTLIEKMLSYLAKKQKRVLILIDDVSSTDEMKKFIFSFQQWIREGYPAFLLMTGLYENISELGKSKSLTFFIRAPKIALEPLNLTSIAFAYKQILDLDDKESAKYAKLTKGYAYGYQVLGSLLFKNNGKKLNLDEYDLKLFDNSYSLIWAHLTEREKQILLEMASTSKQVDICKNLSISNGCLQMYKKRLTDKGLIASKTRGTMQFVLPRFKEFAEWQAMLEE